MNPFKLVVITLYITHGFLPASSQVKKGAGANSLIFEDLPVANTQKNSALLPHENPKEKISRNVFVKAIVNNPRPYFGESVRVTYELYTALQTKSVISQRPQLAGTSGEDLKSDEAQSWQKLLNGRDFKVFRILQMRLKAFQPGELTVDPIEVDNVVEFTGDDGKLHKYSAPVKSNLLKIDFLPLSEKGRPAGFAGTVGVFEINAGVDKSTINVGENNNLHIEISGKGDYEDINLPVIDWPARFDHMAVQEKASGDKRKFPAEGRNVFDIPFVIDTIGNMMFPSIAFSYFDPVKKNYAQIQTALIPLTVRDTPDSTPVQSLPVEKKRISPFILWSAVGFILLTMVSVFFMLRRRANIAKEVARKLAEEAELERIALIAKQIDFRKEWKEVVAGSDGLLLPETARKFLTRLLQEKLNIPDVLEEDILTHMNQPELKQHCLEMYSYCNRLLYAPTSVHNRHEAITQGMQLIMDMLGVPADQSVPMVV